VFSNALLLFVIIDPVGLIPLFAGVLSKVEQRRRRSVLVRELFFALAALIAFLFLGRTVLELLHVSQPALTIAGAMILLLLALPMIFPTIRLSLESEEMSEPFIVPLAVPLFAGPSALAMVMIMGSGGSGDGEGPWSWVGAILLAWSGASGVLLLGDLIADRLGRRGIIALERLMGMLLVAIAVQMFLSGITAYTEQGASASRTPPQTTAGTGTP